MSEEILRLGRNIRVVPVIHQRSVFAAEVRRRFLAERYAAVAVELPPFLLKPVREGAARLPFVSAVFYAWLRPDGEETWAYVPVDPCEGIIEAIRLAVPERIPVHAVDLDLPAFENRSAVLPDEYAVRRASLSAYYEAVRPFLPKTEPGGLDDLRERHMAGELRRLDERTGGPVLFVCGMAHLEGIRRAFRDAPRTEPPEDPVLVEGPRLYTVHPNTLYFFLGELPYMAFLYEKARASLEGEAYEETDGVKDLLLAAAREYRADRPAGEGIITPQRLQLLLTFLRNLCLVERRMTPYLYEFVTAAKGVCGSDFAIKVVQTAKFYPFLDFDSPYPEAAVGLGEARLPEAGRVKAENRLPGPPVTWRRVRLKRPPLLPERRRWAFLWNPFTACSWPPEDDKIESFHRHVRGMTRRILTEDQARVEKFTASVKDGIDLRETLRNWYQGEIYVKELPPARGEVEVVVFVFDDTEDWHRFPWRTTWYAEHGGESTLALYATNFLEDMVGPGVARARYGGCFMLYPPRPVPDIWRDARFDTCRTPAERLTVAALFHSRERFVTYVAPRRPGVRLREAARRLNRHLVYIPLSSFSRETVERLRVVHVLNGRKVRSWAAYFIRNPWRR